jgi:two-component system response regulator RegX3
MPRQIPPIKNKVLLVSDDPDTGQAWVHELSQRGINITLARSTEDALDEWANSVFDITIIDAHTAQPDEIELCRRLSAETINPVLLLIPESGETPILEAYRAGADECILKPVSPALLLAKVTAWLRRSWTISTDALNVLQAGGLRLDPARRRVTTATGAVVDLTNLEFRLLHLLICHCGQVLETDTIIDCVWGYTGTGDVALLKNLVYRLRRKIEPDPGQPRHIQTVNGVGYTFRLK